MSWGKKGEYEIALNDDMRKEAKGKNIRILTEHTEADWYSDDITIKGEKTNNGTDYHGIVTTSFRDKKTCLKMWKGISEAIPGLKCYFCNSQGFKTDVPGVAVCGAAPGWFFFYRRIAKETKPVLKIVNGELVETTEEGVNL